MTAAQPGSPASTSERTALREAIAKREAAKEALRVAGEAAERGKGLVQDVQSKLEKFGDVDAAILKHRALSFKAAAKGGPKPPSLALSADLTKRERARDEAAAELAAARAAHKSLVRELAGAQATVHQAEWNVSDLAGKVLAVETSEQGSGLTDIWSSLWASIDSLKALSSLGVRLPQEVVSTLRSFDGLDHRQWPGGRNSQLARAVSYWKAYRFALTKSADATGSEPIDGAASAAERAA